jgi:hypothetical protein
MGGSYSVWTVGQLTAFGGAKGRPEGSIRFAGEHTSLEQTARGPRSAGRRAAASSHVTVVADHVFGLSPIQCLMMKAQRSEKSRK